jgi:acyl-CoA thioesterase FadM
MSRVRIELPDSFLFTTEIAPRITEINYGGHLGNDSLLAIVHEARVRFLATHGWTEMDVEGVGLLMADAALVYRRQVLYGTVLKVEAAVGDCSRTGFDFLCRLSERDSGLETARAKTGMVFFDYRQRKVVRMPEAFRRLILPQR